MLRIIHALNGEILGLPEAKDELAQIEKEIDDGQLRNGAAYRTAMAGLLVETFEQPERGFALMEKQWERGLLFPGNFAFTIRHSLWLGQRARAELYFDRLRQAHPDYRLLRDLEKELKANLAQDENQER